MSASLLMVFDQYQKARVQFVQAVAEAANRPQQVDVMQNAGVMQLLRPLLLDNVPTIQQTAALALGRLANYSDDLAAAVVENDILPQLIYSLKEQNKHYKKSAAFVLRAVAKHSPELAQAVVDAGALDALVLCLEEFDPSVKEAAAWAIGYIASHSTSLARAVVDSGSVPLLVLCVQEPEISLKRITASALNDIAKHSPELAQAVVDAGAVTFLAPLLSHEDSKLKRQVCSALAQISKHSVDLAEVVVEAEIFPRILVCLKDLDEVVRKNAATCIREVVKHAAQLAKLVVNCGGAVALVNFVKESSGNIGLPGIMALGYIAAFSETMALAILIGKGAIVLKESLVKEEEDHVKAATVWTLGQLGRHTTDHAQALTEAGVLAPIATLLQSPSSSEDLKLKSKRALKAILTKVSDPRALAPLLRENHPKLQKYVLAQFAVLLPHDPTARKAFMASGLLQRTQELKAHADAKTMESILRINALFPEEAVKFSDPQYASVLLASLDA